MNTSSSFSYKGWAILDAIDALKAYDRGARDSGVADESMRAAVHDYLTSIEDDERRRIYATYARQYVSDEGIALGYGVADVGGFLEWLDEQDLPS